MLSNLWCEALVSWRNTLRRPGFALLASITLSIGIGACAISFGLIERLLWKPLPFPESSRLYAAGMQTGSGAHFVTPFEYREISDLEVVQEIGLVSSFPREVTAQRGSESESVLSASADGGFFPTLGVPMRLGRSFVPEEVSGSGPPTAVILSWRLWQRWFDGQPEVIGQGISLEGTPLTIVGVLPESFRLPLPFEVITPLALDEALADGRNYMSVVRLDERAGVGAAGEAVSERLRAAYAGTENAETYMRVTFGLSPLTQQYRAFLQELLVLFLLCALCVLLLASVNVVNLMLLRLIATRQGRSIRGAMGASRIRLMLPAVSEALLIGFFGAIGGLLLASSATGLSHRLVPLAWSEYLAGESIGSATLLMALLAGVIPAVVAALVSIVRDRRAAGFSSLNDESRAGPSLRVGKLTRLLVIGQVTIGVFLLIVAGSFLRTLEQASRVDPGFAAEHVWSFEVKPPHPSLMSAAGMLDRAERLRRELNGLAFVEWASYGTNLPVGEPLNYAFSLPGEDNFSAEFRGVAPAYFETMGIPLLAGRLPASHDRAGGEPVVVVNKAFVDRYIAYAGGPEPGRGLGARLEMPLPDKSRASLSIVGVVGDTRQFGPTQPAPPIVYMSWAQMPASLSDLLREFVPIRYALKTRVSDRLDVDALQRLVDVTFEGQPRLHPRSLAASFAESTRQTRVNLILIGSFAVLALTMSTVGMYSVVAVATASRAREYAIRAALGAGVARLFAAVMKGGLLQAFLGLVLGIAVGLLGASAIGALVPGLAVSDPIVLAGVAIVTIASAIAATIMPATAVARRNIATQLHDH